MIRAFDRQPAFVLGPRMDVLTGNELAWALLTDFPRRPPGDRNLLEWILLDPEPRALYKDWAVIASEMVGVLQLEASANPREPAIAQLVGKLSTRSAEFRTWWSAPNPQTRTAGTKRFAHPVAGDLRINWEAFTVPDQPRHTLFVYSAADQESEHALQILASWRATEQSSTEAGPSRSAQR